MTYNRTIANINIEKMRAEIIAAEVADGVVIIKNGTSINFVFDESINETELDNVIAAHDYSPSLPCDRISIMNSILLAAEQETQMPRLLNALDKYPTFIVALDNYNYAIARARMAIALTAEDITQADYDLIDSKIP